MPDDYVAYYIKKLLRQPNAALARQYLGIQEPTSTSATPGSGSVTSADFVSLRGHVIANSAQMTSADNALSAAINVVSANAALALSVANAVSNRLSTWTLDDLADVSAPAPGDGQVLAFNSAQGQWVASTFTGGSGSVTSADFVSLRGLVQSNSAQMTSADNALSAAINVVSAAVVALSAQHTSLAASVAGALSAIAANSAQMTSADNAISAAAAAVSARVNSVNTVVSNQGSAIVANSAQMTSADNALSAAINVVSGVAATALSVANAVSNRLSTWRLDDLADVSASAPVNGQFIVYNSAAGQWVNSTFAPGSSSVTSAELEALLPLKRVLQGDQIVSATAPVSISGFTFTVSGGVGYGFEFGIFTSTPASVQGNKFVLSGNGPMVGQYQIAGCVGGVSIVNFERGDVTIQTNTVSVAGQARASFVRGTFRAAANGTMQMRVGTTVTATTAASVITVIAGSYGYVWRMV